MTHQIVSNSPTHTLKIGQKIGQKLRGGEVLELISDLGGGKTAFVRGLAMGAGSKDQVQSPTFTVSRVYQGESADIHHFDFYRLSDPGVVAAELAESIADPNVAVAIEWAESVQSVLPKSRLRIKIVATGEESRQFIFEADEKHGRLLEGLV